MSEATCKTCPFWAPYLARDEAETTIMGDCRRHAPTIIATQAEDPRDLVDWHSPFPYTESKDWCGDHPGREAAAYHADALDRLNGDVDEERGTT